MPALQLLLTFRNQESSSERIARKARNMHRGSDVVLALESVHCTLSLSFCPVICVALG